MEETEDVLSQSDFMVDETPEETIEEPEEVTEETIEEEVETEEVDPELEPETADERSDEEVEEELTNFKPLSLKVKVNGEEKEVTYEDEDKLKEAIQRGMSADQKYKDAYQNVQQMESLLENLKDPDKAENILSRLADKDTVLKLAQNVLSREYDLSQMTDEQRAIYEENQALKAEKETREQELNQYQTEQERIQSEQDMDQIIGEIRSVAPDLGLPDDDTTLHAVVGQMEKALDDGIVIDTEQAVKEVRDRYQLGLMNYSKLLEPEQLVSLIGADTVKKINNYSIKQVKKTQQPNPDSNYAKHKGNRSSRLEDKINEARLDDVMGDIWLSAQGT
jgi:hypothetical protein